MRLFAARTKEFKDVIACMYYGNRHHTWEGEKLEKALTVYQNELGDDAIVKDRKYTVCISNGKDECIVCNVEFFVDWQPILSKA